MPDKKLTDSEIVKALECCMDSNCEECPMCSVEDCNKTNLEKLTLDLINRLQADYDRLHKLYLRNQEIFAEQSLENERLKAEIDFYKHSPMVTLFEQWKKEIRAEAYKEFAERLKCGVSITSGIITCENVDNLLKEMVGEGE